MRFAAVGLVVAATLCACSYESCSYQVSPPVAVDSAQCEPGATEACNQCGYTITCNSDGRWDSICECPADGGTVDARGMDAGDSSDDGDDDGADAMNDLDAVDG